MSLQWPLLEVVGVLLCLEMLDSVNRFAVKIVFHYDIWYNSSSAFLFVCDFLSLFSMSYNGGRFGHKPVTRQTGFMLSSLTF